VTRYTCIPSAALLSDERSRFAHIAKHLSARVIGQPEAIKTISTLVSVSCAGLADPHRPLASVLLTGPTGCGKTLLAQMLAKSLFLSAQNLVVINGGDYSEPMTISRLIGTPACTGNDQGGVLTECIRRQPFSIILIEHIDMACHEFIMKLMIVLEDGFLADGDGKRIDFRNCIILMTTTVGSQHIREPGPIDPATHDLVEDTVRRRFPPEFMSRVDELVVLRLLSSEDASSFVDFQLKDLKERLHWRKLEIEVEESARQFLRAGWASSTRGTRRAQHVVEKAVMGALGRLEQIETLHEGDTVRLFKLGNELRADRRIA